MDYIKISLIGLMAVIIYYLALQWSNLPQEEVQFETIENGNIASNEKVLDDSKDSLSALDTTPSGVVESGDSKSTEIAT